MLHIHNVIEEVEIVVSCSFILIYALPIYEEGMSLHRYIVFIVLFCFVLDFQQPNFSHKSVGRGF